MFARLALRRLKFNRLPILALLMFAGYVSCAPKQLPYKGFTDQSALDKADKFVIAQSVGGELDPSNLAKEDQRYSHNGIAYNRLEEGYYQWGARLYGMGYRDWFYVADLMPKAFRRTLLDVYERSVRRGYEDAEAVASK